MPKLGEAADWLTAGCWAGWGGRPVAKGRRELVRIQVRLGSAGKGPKVGGCPDQLLVWSQLPSLFQNQGPPPHRSVRVLTAGVRLRKKGSPARRGAKSARARRYSTPAAEGAAAPSADPVAADTRAIGRGHPVKTIPLRMMTAHRSKLRAGPNAAPGGPDYEKSAPPKHNHFGSQSGQNTEGDGAVKETWHSPFKSGMRVGKAQVLILLAQWLV